MKTKRAGFGVLIAALAAVLLVRGSSGAQSGESDLDYERTTATNALAMLEQQVAQASAPPRVQQWLDIGRESTEQLLAVNDTELARRHFRRATRAFARISQWLRESEPGAEPDDSTLTPAQRLERLHERLSRMERRLAQLSKRAETKEIPLDFNPAAALVSEARQALASSDPRSARTTLRDLKTALLQLEDELLDALEQEGGQ